jgi:hypothetical protein
VLSTSVLTVQEAGWVPWVALLLLMLLEAYATDSRPAAWSQWSAGVQRIVGPGMLPYYAVLAALLAFGPSQIRHISPPINPTFSGSSTGRPGSLQNQYSGGQPTPGRPVGFPGNTAPPRPTTINPTVSGQPGANATGAPSRPSTFPGNPANGAPVRPTVQPPAQPLPSATPPANSAVAPTSSAKPPATPAK